PDEVIVEKASKQFVGGHYYASAVQPFAYLQLVFASILGVFAFGEVIRTNVAIGTVIIVMAGLFTLWRERQAKAG
ncbi:MAG: hypothetical protein ACO3VR_07445, partial [Lutimaribacter sp.]